MFQRLILFLIVDAVIFAIGMYVGSWSTREEVADDIKEFGHDDAAKSLSTGQLSNGSERNKGQLCTTQS